MSPLSPEHNTGTSEPVSEAEQNLLDLVSWSQWSDTQWTIFGRLVDLHEKVAGDTAAEDMCDAYCVDATTYLETRKRIDSLLHEEISTAPTIEQDVARQKRVMIAINLAGTSSNGTYEDACTHHTKSVSEKLRHLCHVETDFQDFVALIRSLLNCFDPGEDGRLLTYLAETVRKTRQPLPSSREKTKKVDTAYDETQELTIQLRNGLAVLRKKSDQRDDTFRRKYTEWIAAQLDDSVTTFEDAVVTMAVNFLKPTVALLNECALTYKHIPPQAVVDKAMFGLISAAYFYNPEGSMDPQTYILSGVTKYLATLVQKHS